LISDQNGFVDCLWSPLLEERLGYKMEMEEGGSIFNAMLLKKNEPIS